MLTANLKYSTGSCSKLYSIFLVEVATMELNILAFKQFKKEIANANSTILSVEEGNHGFNHGSDMFKLEINRNCVQCFPFEGINDRNLPQKPYRAYNQSTI